MKYILSLTTGILVMLHWWCPAIVAGFWTLEEILKANKY